MAKRNSCPSCGGDEIVRNGKDRHGQQRYKCRACGFRPSHPSNSAPASIEPAHVRGHKVLVITSAQNDTELHRAAWGALKTYCDERNAKLLVVPTRYKNPDAFHEGADSEYTWPAETIPHLVDRDIKLHKHLMLMGDAKIGATSPNPLGNKESLAGTMSAIYGHAQLQMRLVPTPRNELPRILHTTGSVSVPNYGRSDLAKRARFHHVLGALVVELVGGRFHMRELLVDRTGGFYDLARYYTTSGSRPAERAAALVLGDEHVKFSCPRVHAATFGPGGMVETLRPQVLVRHDMHDHYSGSHHHEKDTLLRVAKAHGRDTCVREELELLRDYITKTTPSDTVSAIVQSNHHDHLRQWINRFDANRDPGNAVFAWKLLGRIAEAIESGGDTDPFRVWLRANLPADTAARVQFLDPNEPHELAGVDVSQHGDRGANGAKGGAGFAKLNRKMFLGHSHTPRIEKGAWWVGVSAPDMAYAVGLSSWLSTHGVIYPNGKRALLHVINGHWHG